MASFALKTWPKEQLSELDEFTKLCLNVIMFEVSSKATIPMTKIVKSILRDHTVPQLCPATAAGNNINAPARYTHITIKNFQPY